MQPQTLQQHSAAEGLERHLGDPFAPDAAFSFARSVALDDRDEYPEEACALLDAWGLQDFYVPTRAGGRQDSFEELCAVLRVVARRDLTAAIAHGKTYLGAVAAWVGGSEGQQRRLAELIKGGAQVALAVTEREHGSDLLASEARAERVEGGYLLSGEKWLINNATRGRALTVFARTREEGGPRGFSLFLVEKDAARPTHTHLPRLKTHGVRGADISGIRFDATFVPDDLVVGGTGGGLETILKAFQLTRTVIAALSLGAADTALRVTTDFALSRKLYGAAAFDIPNVRRTLADAFADLLICECVTTAAARSLHVEPEQMSLRSAVAKYFVPVTAEEVVNNLSVVMGARQYLRQEHHSGVFQKIARDNSLLSLFDGSTAVNLGAIAMQLGQLAGSLPKRGARPDDLDERLARLFDLTRPLPEFDPAALTLHNGGRDSVLQGLGDAVERVESLECEGEAEAGVCRQVAELARAVLAEAEAQAALVTAALGGRDLTFKKSPEMFEQAGRYCALHAAACCLHLWLHSRAHVGGFFAEGRWLVYCLARLLRQLGVERRAEIREHEGALAGEVKRLVAEELMLSLFPLRLAPRAAAQVSFEEAVSNHG